MYQHAFLCVLAWAECLVQNLPNALSAHLCLFASLCRRTEEAIELLNYDAVGDSATRTVALLKSLAQVCGSAFSDLTLKDDLGY